MNQNIYLNLKKKLSPEICENQAKLKNSELFSGKKNEFDNVGTKFMFYSESEQTVHSS